MNLATLAIEHEFADGLTIKNHTMFGDYRQILPEHLRQQRRACADRDLPSGSRSAGYNNRNNRRNLFSQTDLVWENRLAGIDQTLLFGFEVGREKSRNYRNTATLSGDGNAGRRLGAADRSDSASRRRLRPHRQRCRTIASRRRRGRYTSRTRSVRPTWLEIVAGLRFDSFKLDVDDLRPAGGGKFEPPRQSVVAAARPDPQAARQFVDLHQLQPVLPAAVGRPVQRPRPTTPTA